MPHTKRSPEFQKRRQEAIAFMLKIRNPEPNQSQYFEEQCDAVIELLDRHTTDSPCIVKAADDEPLFVLRAQDETSDEFVFLWAQKLRTIIANLSVQISDDERERLMKKWEDALMCAAEMRSYPKRKRPD